MDGPDKPGHDEMGIAESTVRKIWLAFLSALLSNAAFAANPMAVSGVGVQTCAEYAANYKNDPAYWKGIYFSWAQGFMSALNAAHIASKGAGYRDLGFIAPEVQEQNIREFCNEHPLANYTDSVFALYQSLPLQTLK